ncbi:tetratricopeptide repeat protein 5 isoform X1 [Spatholobus suberectus]|nr:tetratricopeptide repeat protein 5 isoform X1 [Spatholobus suberectus]
MLHQLKSYFRVNCALIIQIKEGDQLTLLDPYFRNVDLSWKEKHYQFKSIRLDFYEQVLVNGKALTPQQLLVRQYMHNINPEKATAELDEFNLSSGCWCWMLYSFSK